jgi:large subunit ribosomal protein L23
MSTAMQAERLLKIILAPQVSEKSTYVAEKNQHMFRVLQDATKPEIKAAIELIFNVQVNAVQVANHKGKSKRFGKFNGRRRNWKTAFVCLKQGQELNLTAAEIK